MMLNYFKRLGSLAIYIWWKNAQLSMISHQMKGGDKMSMNMEEVNGKFMYVRWSGYGMSELVNRPQALRMLK